MDGWMKRHGIVAGVVVVVLSAGLSSCIFAPGSGGESEDVGPGDTESPEPTDTDGAEDTHAPVDTATAEDSGGGSDTASREDSGTREDSGDPNECSDCDDGNRCTEDRCEDGKCVHEVVRERRECCETTDQCPNSDCLIGVRCEDYQCEYEELDLTAEGCCEVSSDCPDPGPCSVPHCDELHLCSPRPKECPNGTGCVEGKCVPDDAGCATSDDCDDGDGCTRDICTQNYECVNRDISGCCLEPNDCPDMTTVCDDQAMECVGRECREDADCEEGEICDGGICRNT